MVPWSAPGRWLWSLGHRPCAGGIAHRVALGALGSEGYALATDGPSGGDDGDGANRSDGHSSATVGKVAGDKRKQGGKTGA